MTEKLSDKLAAQREGFMRMAPQSAQDVMKRSAEQLKKSGILDSAKQVGDHVSDFVLNNIQGVPVNFAELRKEKRVVICFYRGGW